MPFLQESTQDPQTAGLETMDRYENPTHAVQELPPTRDFARIADRYDESRHLPAQILLECYHQLEQQDLLHRSDHILDAGCGTGQLSLPLVRLGYSVTGVDIAEAMIEQFRSKLSPPQTVTLHVADVRQLPIETKSIDVAISSKLFMHVPRWELAVDEMLRVVRPKGHFFHIYERGAFMNIIRARFAAICDALGYRNRHLGLQSEEQLANYLLSRGARRIYTRGPVLRWTKTVTYREAIAGFAARLFGEFWGLNDAVYNQILATVVAWAEEQPQGLDTIEPMTPWLEVEGFVLL